jgi:hypothetical protein
MDARQVEACDMSRQQSVKLVGPAGFEPTTS